MGDIFNRLVDMNANEILSYRFMPAMAGSGKLIKDQNNSFAFFAQILAPNRRHQFLPKYVELGIYRRRQLLLIIGQVGSVRPAVRVPGRVAAAIFPQHPHLP